MGLLLPLFSREFPMRISAPFIRSGQQSGLFVTTTLLTL